MMVAMKANQNGGAARVLVVDDEANITDLVATALRYEGFDVESAGTGARRCARSRRRSGPTSSCSTSCCPTSTASRSRGGSREPRRAVPVVFLTARDSTEDKVHGLTVGGDDYVTKPFSLEELVARVRAVLRRTGARRRRQSRCSRSPTSSSTTTRTRSCRGGARSS